MCQYSRIFLTSLLVISFCCCERIDKSDPRKLTLINNTDRNVIFYYSLVRDSVAIDLGSLGNREDFKSVNSNESRDYSLFGSNWEHFFGSFHNETTIMFVLDLDSVKRHAGSTIPYPASGDEILKRQLINIDTLINNNWTLTYP